MADLTTLAETKLPDGTIVKPGDMVVLVDEPPLGKQTMEVFLGGSGPYKIAKISQRPCGSTVLFFNINESHRLAHARNFRAAPA